jgi:hypothetical protein
MRRRYASAAVAVTVSAVLGVAGSAAGSPAVSYPAPDGLPAVTTVTAAGLPDRYAAAQRAVAEALAVARAADDRRRATILASLAGRDLLEFDGRGNGRAVEVIGDLAGADRIAVVVPGSHTTLDSFDRNRGPGGGARALIEEMAAVDPDARVAAVAWLGYDTPQGVSPRSATDGLARDGAAALHATVTALHGVNPEATVSLLCHSYGSVVCTYAATADLPVADLVIYGSPGVGAASAGELATGARVWAGRAADDWIRFVPYVRVAGIGFGPDPVGPDFGALPFPAGDGGHGDYHLRGGESLHSLALIALGSMEVPGE